MNESFCKLNIVEESNDLAKVLLEPNQKWVIPEKIHTPLMDGVVF